MSQEMKRAQFLRGNFSAKEALRPPWSVVENEFVDLCDRCDACIKACPSHVLKRGDAGFPILDFHKSGCDFCEACVSSCPTHALFINPEHDSEPWQIIASFKSNCLSENGVVCRSCGDVCEGRAIRFEMIVGGSALLKLDSSMCNGCGECVSICPVQAIEMKHLKVESPNE